MQTRTYRWRRPTCRREPHAIRSWDHSNDRRTLVISSLDDGRSSQAVRPRSLTPGNHGMIPFFSGHRNRHSLAADSTAGGASFAAAFPSTGGCMCCQTMPSPRLDSRAPGRRGTAMTADHHRWRQKLIRLANASTVHLPNLRISERQCENTSETPQGTTRYNRDLEVI